MTPRRMLAIGAIAIVAAMLVGPAAIIGAQDGAPTVSLDRTGAKAGEAVTVSGTGWSGSDLVYLELCGNAGRSGSSSCDQAHAVLTGVGPQGSFTALLTVAEPPKPCPCVIKVTSQTTQAFATGPLAVQGVPVVALENQTEMYILQRSVAITEATLNGSGPWTAWFGGGAERTLAITVENTGEVALHDPPLTVTAGKGSDPTGIVPAPELGTIEPGQSITVELPITFDAMSFGQHTATVAISGFAEPVAARASTSTYPWGLLALAAVAVQLVLLGLRNAARRRIEGAALWDDAAAAEISSEHVRVMALTGAGAAETGGDPVIDLREGAVSSGGSEPQQEGSAPTAVIPQDQPVAPEPDGGEHRGSIDDPLIDDWLVLGATTGPVLLAGDARAAERTELPVEDPPAAERTELAVEDPPAPERTELPVAAPSEPDSGDPADVAIAAGTPPATSEPSEPSEPEPDAGTTGRSEAVEVSSNGLRDAASSNVRLVGSTAWIGEEWRSAPEALEEAKLLSSSILDVATRRADAIVQQAMAMRAGAAAVLDEARVTVEHIINVALINAEAIRQDAEQQREAASRATQDARQEVSQLVADATTLLEERLAAVALQAVTALADAPPPDRVIDLDDPEAETTGAQAAIDIDQHEAETTGARAAIDLHTSDAAAPRLSNALDSAIERAVQKALQG